MILRTTNAMIEHDICPNGEFYSSNHNCDCWILIGIFNRNRSMMMIKNQEREIQFPIRPFEIKKMRMSSIKFPLDIFPYSSCLSRFFLGDIQLSLCGNFTKQAPITDELFNTHLISYDTFVQNPTIVHDSNLVVRIGGK